MPDKYSKVEPKIHPITIAVIIGVLILVVGIVFSFQPSDRQVIYDAYVLGANDDFSEEHPFQKVTFEGSLFNKGLDERLEQEGIVVVFVSFPECPSCLAHIGAIQKYFFSEGFDEHVDSIYYLNPTEDNEGFEMFAEAYSEVGTTTPQLLVFQDGVVIATFTPQSSDVATVINRSLRDFFQEALTKIE